MSTNPECRYCALSAIFRVAECESTRVFHACVDHVGDVLWNLTRDDDSAVVEVAKLAA